MKRGIYLFTILLCTGLIFLSSCKKDEVPPVDDTQVIDDPDPDPDPDPGPDPDPDGSTSTIDEINAAFTFNNSSFKTGTPPSSANLGDLKIDKDTINIWPGIKNRIAILNHSGISISGVVLSMPGADGYHEVAIEPEESNDTLAIFYIDIDPNGLELPFNNFITIVPTDGSGNGIDNMNPVVHGDTPFDPTNTTYTPSGISCSPASDENLFWIYTTHDGLFFDGPYLPFYQSDYSVDGCCTGGLSYYTCHPADENASVDVTEQYSATNLEVIHFFGDGSGIFAYSLYRTFNDFWLDDTDWCSKTVGYKLREPKIDTTGNYIVQEVNSNGDMVTIAITNLDFTTDDLLNTGFGPISRVNEGNPQLIYHLGCRFYVETVLTEGKEILRVFESKGDVWYD